ncbi:MAG: DnaJ domain-containing protein [Anaerolineae bacterium]|jgi:DnaJ-class molecular chaperone
MADDHYDTLGVEADATLEQIKSAYRKKAKSLHPDHCGGGGGPFRAVQEAYEVLSDPQQRQAYDCEQARAERARQQARRVRPDPLRRRRAPVEPLAPAAPPGFSPADPFGASFSSLLDELLGGPPPRSRRRSEGLHVEVELSAEEARRGGRFQVLLPVISHCPTCQGYGALGRTVCMDCRGRGSVAREVPLVVRFPAGVMDGDAAALGLDSIGLRGAELTVHFRVAGYW